MKFQVPQFIEVEDKIFGPFTFKQFVYIVGGAGISFVLYKALPFFFAVLLIIPIISLTAALAFYRINNRSFIVLLESMFKYAIASKLYTWKKEEKKPTKREKNYREKTLVFVPRLSQSKLKDIAWSLDVHDSIYAGQESERKPARGLDAIIK